MRSRLYLLALSLFILVLLYDLVVWGAVRSLPEIGPNIADAARHEAPLATTYVAIGGLLDSLVPGLEGFGADRFAEAMAGAEQGIEDDPTLALDVVFGPSLNAAHRWLKIFYWAAPVLALIAIVLWVRKPRQLHVVRR